jgi:DinB superfamily
MPREPVCAGCGFEWVIDADGARRTVRVAPERLQTIFSGRPGRASGSAGVWSPAAYLWHLVDVLRIGAERLWTLELDPAAGIPGWDENALAEVRGYDQLSAAVGLRAFARAAVEWQRAADTPASTVVHHAEFGKLTAIDIIRRNAHEVVHHQLDIERGLEAD